MRRFLLPGESVCLTVPFARTKHNREQDSSSWFLKYILDFNGLSGLQMDELPLSDIKSAVLYSCHCRYVYCNKM